MEIHMRYRQKLGGLGLGDQFLGQGTTKSGTDPRFLLQGPKSQRSWDAQSGDTILKLYANQFL
jgi:hypothetical protein